MIAAICPLCTQSRRRRWVQEDGSIRAYGRTGAMLTGAYGCLRVPTGAYGRLRAHYGRLRAHYGRNFYGRTFLRAYGRTLRAQVLMQKYTVMCLRALTGALFCVCFTGALYGLTGAPYGRLRAQKCTLRALTGAYGRKFLTGLRARLRCHLPGSTARTEKNPKKIHLWFFKIAVKKTQII